MACLPPQVWDGVLRRLGEELPPFAVQAWLRPLAVERAGGGLSLLCPTPLHRRRVEERYRDRIERCLSRALGEPVTLRLEVRAGARAPADEASVPDATPRSEGGGGVCRATPAPHRRSSAPAPRQRSLDYTFGNFVVGEANALARNAAQALAEERDVSVSPLYLVSDPGLGKTHLARAAATEARTRGGGGVVCASAEQFTNELMGAFRSRRLGDFKRRYRRECRLLVLDDVQFLAGKEATQLELFHTLEFLQGAGARVLLTGSRLPREIAGLDERLVSRMDCGFVAEIEPPSIELRQEILRAKAACGGVRVPTSCIDRLVEAVSGSIRDLESVLIQLVATASLLKRPIDAELTEAALRKVLPQRPRDVRLDPITVADTVASFFGTTREAMASRSRRREVLVPRQVAMYLCRRYTDASLKEIGRCFRREHPSVSNAISAVERSILERAPLRYQVESLSSRLCAGSARAGGGS